MNDWKNVDDELPAEDGLYECKVDDNHMSWTVALFYNGYGFKHEHAYRPIKYWRNFVPLPKKYGKVKIEDETNE